MPDHPSSEAERTARDAEQKFRAQDAQLAAAVRAKQERSERARHESEKVQRENDAILDIGGQNRP